MLDIMEGHFLFSFILLQSIDFFIDLISLLNQFENYNVTILLNKQLFVLLHADFSNKILSKHRQP